MSIQPSRGVNAVPTDPTRVLEQIKRLVLEHLGGLPGEFYGPIEETLNAAAVGGDDAHAGQVVYQSQSALWVLRQHHAAQVMRYRQQIAQGFDDFRSPHARNQGDQPLGLVEDTQIDFHLAGQALVTVLQQHFDEPLEVMDRRLGLLAAALGVESTINPIGPLRLANTFVETFSDEQIPEILRGHLFGHYQHELIRTLDEIYAKANTLLATAGYGVAEVPRRPPISAGLRSPAPSGQGQLGHGESGHADGFDGRGGRNYDGHGHADHIGHGGHGGYDHQAGNGRVAESDQGYGRHGPAGQSEQAGRAGHGHRGQAGAGANTGGDSATPHELGELRSMLHAWREGALNRPAEPANHAKADASSQWHELRLDEVVSVASLLQAEPADAFARALAGSGALADVIRQQLSGGSRRLGLDPQRIRFSTEDEDAIDLVGLVFDSLFHSQQFEAPARRVYARLVLPFVKVALTDQQLFVQPTHPARRLFDSITEAIAGNRGETAHERELLDRATAISQRVVAEYNEDLAIFEIAHHELDTMLQQQRRRIELQAERAAKATYGRERLNHAREYTDTLLSRRLAAPPLSPAVAEFLSTTWRHHLVQVLLREGPDSEQLVEAVALGDSLVEADRIAAEGRGRDLARHLLAIEPAISTCLASSGLGHSAAEHGLAVLVKGLVYPNTPRDLHPAPASEAEEDAQEKHLWLDKGERLEFDPSQADQLRSLAVGSWLQVTDIRGNSSAAKIAWVSPVTGRRLLVSRRGVRLLVASVEELAMLAGVGRLRTGCEPTAFEQAMQHVRVQLDRAAHTH
ncbi:DUF1631 family protein [Lysobacter sp. A286]